MSRKTPTRKPKLPRAPLPKKTGGAHEDKTQAPLAGTKTQGPTRGGVGVGIGSGSRLRLRAELETGDRRLPTSTHPLARPVRGVRSPPSPAARRSPAQPAPRRRPTNTTRMLCAATSPAIIEPTADPMSDAPVRNPKLAPCASTGITAPAAVKAAVVATPMLAADDADGDDERPLLGRRRQTTPAPVAPSSAAPVITIRAVACASAAAASWLPAAPDSASSENSTPTSRVADVGSYPSASRCSSRIGPERAVHHLQAEDHDHQQQEVLEGEDVREGHGRRALRRRGGAGRLPVEIR